MLPILVINDYIGEKRVFVELWDSDIKDYLCFRHFANLRLRHTQKWKKKRKKKELNGRFYFLHWVFSDGKDIFMISFLIK